MIRKATAEDLPAVVRLLSAADLPAADLSANSMAGFHVFVDPGGLISGACGLESYGSCGLLRSLVVIPTQQGRGVGMRLVGVTIEAAQEAGLMELFLLTTTAESYFLRAGWNIAERSLVPPDLQSSTEFSSLCPSTAACLRIKIS